MEVKADDLWPLVLHFVKEYLSEEDLGQFTTHFKLTTDKMDENPLVQAGGLPALLTTFLKQNKKVYRKFKAYCSSSGSPDEDDTPETEKKRDSKKAKKEKKAEAQQVGKKRKRSESNASELACGDSIKRRRASSMASVDTPVEEKKEKKFMKPVGDFKFKRIDESKFEGKIGAQFQNNTFEAKALFGQGGDSYGTWANNKLKVTVGKGFTKEKNKMKNRNSHVSGRFEPGRVNSIKL